MNDERIESIQYAAEWLSRSDDIGNRKHAERLRALLADGGKGEAVALWAAFAPEGNLLAHSKLRPGLSEILNWEPLYRTAPQAECAPREAQPVGPRTTLNYDGTFDTTCAHCGGNGCFACLKSAAPTPERADADTAGAGDLEALLADVTAIDTWHRGSPSYEHDANWFKDRVIRLLEKRIAADASERADAGKDAALTERERFWCELRSIHDPDDLNKHEVELAWSMWQARAILAANKEPK
jgi:hypothetical protein